MALQQNRMGNLARRDAAVMTTAACADLDSQDLRVTLWYPISISRCPYKIQIF